jgi:hypothetical protein
VQAVRDARGPWRFRLDSIVGGSMKISLWGIIIGGGKGWSKGAGPRSRNEIGGAIINNVGGG